MWLLGVFFLAAGVYLGWNARHYRAERSAPPCTKLFTNRRLFTYYEQLSRQNIDIIQIYVV